MSSGRSIRRRRPGSSRDIVDRDRRRVAGLADAFGHVVLVDALQRLLAGRVERRHDDVVGLAEAGAEIAEQVVHARIAVRLEHGDDAPRAPARAAASTAAISAG